MLSSVIQGSVLGSTLFNIYIDDIDDWIEMFIRKFADGTKIARRIKEDQDRQEMQEDLERLSEWAEKWEMAFNVEKCKVMHVGKKNPKHEYEMNGKKLIETEEEKDLGIIVDSSLK